MSSEKGRQDGSDAAEAVINAVADHVRWGILSTADIALTKVIPGLRRSERSQVLAIASRDEKPSRRPTSSGPAALPSTATARMIAVSARSHGDVSR